MKDREIQMQDKARAFLAGIAEPYSSADIIDAFIAGAYAGMPAQNTEKHIDREVDHTPIDVVINNIIHYTFDITQSLLEINNRSARILRLDESLTKEQRQGLKREAGMTDSAIMTLARCKRNYQAILKDLDTLSPYMNSRIDANLYDFSVAMTDELIAVLILYMVQTNNDNEATRHILTAMIDEKPLDKSIANVVRTQLGKATSRRERIIEKHNADRHDNG